MGYGILRTVQKSHAEHSSGKQSRYRASNLYIKIASVHVPCKKYKDPLIAPPAMKILAAIEAKQRVKGAELRGLVRISFHALPRVACIGGRTGRHGECTVEVISCFGVATCAWGAGVEPRQSME